MRNLVVSITCGVAILIALQAHAQSNVSGTWKGMLRQAQGGTEPEFDFDLHLEQTGTKVVGTSRISLTSNKKYYGVMTVTGTLQGNVLEFLEGSIVENYPEPGTYWCIKRGKLKFSESAGNARLEGSWTASGCAPGTIDVAREAGDDEQEAEEGQRRKAMRLACSAPPGSLGKASICPNFDPAYVGRFFFNWCAGGVGDLYEKNKTALEAPATDENIEKWAAMETKYFKGQDDCTAFLGSLLSLDTRVEWMKEARDKSNKNQ